MHYAHILTINRLRIQVHLGFYEQEREQLQPVEISIRMYFPEAPPCARDDHGKFLDYGAMAEAMHGWATSKKFRLLEYMGQQAFQFVREYIDYREYTDVKLWLELIKCEPPVPGLQGGTSYIHCDLPVGATAIMAHAV